MKLPDADDPLEALLQTPEPYVDDAGFTQRVLQRLPPRRNPATRTRILWGFGLAATAAVALGPGREVADSLLHATFGWSALALAVLVFTVLAGTAVSVALREAQS
jgi:hypothetical protein